MESALYKTVRTLEFQGRSDNGMRIASTEGSSLPQIPDSIGRIQD